MVLSPSKPSILTHLCQLPAQHTTQSQRCTLQRPLTAWAACSAGAGDPVLNHAVGIQDWCLQYPGTPGGRATLSCGVDTTFWLLHLSAVAAASCLLLARAGGWAAVHMAPSADSHTPASLWHGCCRSAEAIPSSCALEGFGSRGSSRALQHIRQQVLLAQQQLFNPSLHLDDGSLSGQGALRRHKQKSSRGLGTTRHSSPSLLS